MFAILTRVPELAAHRKQLEKFFIYYAASAWTGWAKDWYERPANKSQVEISEILTAKNEHTNLSRFAFLF